MSDVASSNSFENTAQQGFTLVELITVVILLSIIAIAVVPRFTGSSGYSEFALQKRLLSALRNTQLKAMYDTRTDFCYKLVFAAPLEPAFGPTTHSYLDGNQAASCGNTIDFSSDSFLRTDEGEVAASNVSFSAQDNTAAITFIQFDNLGRAITSAGSCASACTFTFTDESAAKVCVEDEGYVHAC